MVFASSDSSDSTAMLKRSRGTTITVTGGSVPAELSIVDPPRGEFEYSPPPGGVRRGIGQFRPTSPVLEAASCRLVGRMMLRREEALSRSHLVEHRRRTPTRPLRLSTTLPLACSGSVRET